MCHMKALIVSLILLSHLQSFSQAPVENYPIDSASVEHVGIPKGEVLKFTFASSKIFPGTTRDYWVYIPRQYNGKQPACVYVNQDGIQWKAPTVFDNLIQANEMPVTIGIFVTPGIVKAADANTALNRFNRSFEYDGLGDNYVRFLLEELLPEVETKTTTDGRPVRLSRNGNDRAIGGSSSGAVCAFTAAWERPGEFSRVFSAIGTYIGLRGAERYPTLIRKYEPKPLRIFLQDGTNDLNIYAGDWWKANETMERALTFAGYEVNHVWGEGQYSGLHGSALFPQAMRWLWKKWPEPVKTSATKNQFLSDLLIKNEPWELIGDGYGFTEGIIADAKGDIFFQDIPNSKTYHISADNKIQQILSNSKGATGTSIGSNGTRYTDARLAKQILGYNAGKEQIVAEDIVGNDLVVAANGNMYITEPDGREKPGKLWLITPAGKKQVVDEGLKFCNGLALSPDQTQLYVTESASQWVWIYFVQPDGTLTYKQKYGWLHVPDSSNNAWGDGIKCDTAGRVYVASRLGIQVLDQTGRVNAIIPVPNNYCSNLCFGGPDYNIMYVTCNNKIYRRRLNTRGSNTFEPPHKPVIPRL